MKEIKQKAANKQANLEKIQKEKKKDKMKPLVKKAKSSKKDNIPKLVPADAGKIDKGENLREIDNLDDQIAALEAKLGVANDSKGRRKLKKQAEMEGMGVGFMDFVDEISGIVKGNTSKYEKRDYDFNDESKEVLLNFEKFDGAAAGARPAEDDGSDQSGFEQEEDDEDMEEIEAEMSEKDESSDEEDEDMESSLEEEEGEEGGEVEGSSRGRGR